jgi:protein-L-isoaspartate(D-aspartate) O-methyltransferase
VLVETSRKRLRRLGYGNVEIVAADGTVGWAAEAPYDAILVAASGSHVPDALVAQIAPGGRLVMPIGAAGAVQRLVQVIRRADGTIEQLDLGAVRFVPLIGEEGWKDG